MARGDDLLDPRVEVVVTPPSDPAAAGHEELQGVGSGDDRPPMAELAERPWLTQGEALGGARFETLGLAVYAGHPELALVALPHRLHRGRRAPAQGARDLRAGGRGAGGRSDVMQMRHDLHLIGVVATPGAEGEVLRVVLLA